MDTKLYQDFVKTTFIVPEENQFSYLINGITSEAGEVSGAYAKWLREDYDYEELVNRLEKECGDVLYNLAMLGNLIGVSLDAMMVANRDKLIDRQNRNTLRGCGDDR